MKKLLLLFTFAGILTTKSGAQCISTCSNYFVAPITYSLFPTGGTNVVSSFSPTADDGIVNVPIGFNFTYYCSTYTAVNICSNGFIQLDYGTPVVFGNPPLSQPAQAFPSTAQPDGIIALNMNDLDATTTGAITYTTIGTAPNRMFVVTYSNVPIWNSAQVLNSGQIVLFETSNNVEIHSASINQSPYAMTQGMENTNGTIGTTVPGRSASYWTATQDAYRFGPYSPVSTPPISGTTSICAGDQGNYSVTPNASALSYSWTLPGGWYGTYTTSAISLPVGASGNIQASIVYTCGVSTPSTLSVTVIPSPVVSSSLSTPVICSGEEIEISVSGAVSYTLEPDGLTGVYPFTVSPSANTTYSVFGTDANGCNSINSSQTSVLVNDSPTVTVNDGTVCVGHSFTINPIGADTYSYSNGFATVTPPTDGVFTYTVFGTNNNGCNGDPVISTVTVAPSPSIALSANRMTICNGETTTITANGADTYTWVNGPSTNTYAVHPISTMLYKVTGTSVEGCLKTTSITITVAQCTGIAENSAAGTQLISVYPNPSNGEFTISAAEETHIEIYDLQGKLIFKQDLQSGDHAINMSSVNAGQYFLKATGTNSHQSAHLIKE